jgi:hypothetical protein
MADVKKCVRLACVNCDREDFDGITPKKLAAMKAKGEWQDISEVQTYEESIKTYGNPDGAPPGFDVTKWYTHLGACPECAKDIAEEDALLESTEGT